MTSRSGKERDAAEAAEPQASDQALSSVAAQIPDHEIVSRRDQLLALLAEALFRVARFDGSTVLASAPRPRVTKAKAGAIIDNLVEIIEGLRESTGPVVGLGRVLQHVQAGHGGSHFTPVPVARLIVRLAIHRWLVSTTDAASEEVAELLFGPEAPSLTRPDHRALLAAVRRVRVYDPAAGGGVFLLAAMETIAATRLRLGDTGGLQKICGEIIDINLHGVEIEPAVAAVASAALLVASRWTPQPHQHRHAIVQSLPWPVLARNALLNHGRPGSAHPGLQAIDILVGNPPYQRQERQADSKAIGQAMFKKTTGMALSGRADASVPFFGLVHYLDRNGVGALLTPSAWLDAEYGGPLQQYLRGFGNIAVLESGIERWFPPDVKVNTAVTFVTRATHADNIAPVRFVDLQQPVLELGTVASIALATSVTPDRPTRQAVDGGLVVLPCAVGRVVETSLSISEAKLGQFLRTPTLWLNTLEEFEDRMVRLDKIATVTNGLKTGNNKMFVVEDVTDLATPANLSWRFGMTRTELKSKGFRVVVPSGIRGGLNQPQAWHRLPARALRPFLLNADELTSPRIRGSKLRWRIINAHLRKQAERLASYIAWGGHAGVTRGSRRRPSKRLPLKSPILPALRSAPVIVIPNQSFGRGVVGIVGARDRAVASNNFFTIATHPEWSDAVVAYLMSSPGLLERERVGRTALGDGGLKTDGIDLKQIRLPDPWRMPARLRQRLQRLVEEAMNREFAPILDELGADPWREGLDRAVLEWLGIEPGSYGSFQRALRHALERRLVKAECCLAE